MYFLGPRFAIIRRILECKELITRQQEIELGSNKVAKRLGRGPGSGKGKTSGRGHKGHKSRSGGG